MIRTYLGEGLALALTACWLFGSGIYLAGMVAALRIEGRR